MYGVALVLSRPWSPGTPGPSALLMCGLSTVQTQSQSSGYLDLDYHTPSPPGIILCSTVALLVISTSLRLLRMHILRPYLLSCQALETARTANRRLREEVTASTEELAAIKTQQAEDARRHSQSLVAAKSALDEVWCVSVRFGRLRETAQHVPNRGVCFARGRCSYGGNYELCTQTVESGSARSCLHRDWGSKFIAPSSN